MRATALARDCRQVDVVETAAGLECPQATLLYPGLGVMVGQVADITPGEYQKGHAFAVRRAGRAVQCLVMALHIRRQTEGRSDGFLLVEPLIFELLVIDI